MNTKTGQETKTAAAIELLKSWREGDGVEQRETGEYLIRVLDEDRLSDRPLFPRGMIVLLDSGPG